jgi:hypothetical protein
MEKSSNHLCELLSPCCLELISKSVVLEILRVFISILFFSILIEIVSLMIFSIITYFYPSLCDKEEKDLSLKEESNRVPEIKQKSNPVKDLFKSSTLLPSYNFDF